MNVHQNLSEIIRIHPGVLLLAKFGIMVFCSVVHLLFLCYHINYSTSHVHNWKSNQMFGLLSLYVCHCMADVFPKYGMLDVHVITFPTVSSQKSKQRISIQTKYRLLVQLNPSKFRSAIGTKIRLEFLPWSGG